MERVPGPVRVQVTDVSGVPVTIAVNCCVWLALSVTVGGVTEMVTVGDSVTRALADFVPSATLVAVTVAVCPGLMLAGAV